MVLVDCPGADVWQFKVVGFSSCGLQSWRNPGQLLGDPTSTCCKLALFRPVTLLSQFLEMEPVIFNARKWYLLYRCYLFALDLQLGISRQEFTKVSKTK